MSHPRLGVSERPGRPARQALGDDRCPTRAGAAW
jgi:hypothetical protein